MSKFENSSIGSVSVKIGVTAEPSDKFSDVAHALGFVRVVPCSDCAHRGTQKCPVRDSAEYMAFCSSGRKRDDDQR